MHGQIALMFRLIGTVVTFEHFGSGPMLPFHVSLQINLQETEKVTRINPSVCCNDMNQDYVISA